MSELRERLGELVRRRRAGMPAAAPSEPLAESRRRGARADSRPVADDAALVAGDPTPARTPAQDAAPVVGTDTEPARAKARAR
ncbi:MAG: hypothetical protein ABL977_02085, partial [Candidatus Eisenbacteria bacterium]